MTSGGLRNIGDQFRIGGFVAGSQTPLADMANLKSNNITASYALNMDARGATGCCPSGNISVSFGTGTWDGDWHGLTNNYNTYIKAKGIVTGNQFSSNNLSVIDQNSMDLSNGTPTPGNVLGTFNGDNAQNLTGMIDVTVNGQNSVGVFVGSKFPNIGSDRN